MLNKMSYLKITDPTKRDYLVQQLINTRKEILQDSINETFGDIKFQQDLTKMYKPLTEKVEPVLSTMKALPTTLTESMKAITFPTVQAIEGLPLTSPPSSPPPMELGEIATEYLRKFTEQANTTDKTFGIHDRGGKFYIGNVEILLNDDNITLQGDPPKTYKGTPGLWELIVTKQPNSDIFNINDLENYQEILVHTNALKRNNDPNEVYPKSSRGIKWLNLLKPIWEKNYPKKQKSGKGVSPDKLIETIILPSDQQALLKRLDLLLASKQAGNTGLRNELVAICDELKRQGIVTDEQYAEFNKIINK